MSKGLKHTLLSLAFPALVFAGGSAMAGAPGANQCNINKLCAQVEKTCPINQRVGKEVTTEYAYFDSDFGSARTGSYTADSYVPNISQTYTDGLRTNMNRLIKDVTANGRNQHATVFIFPEGTTDFEPGKHIAKFPKVNFGSNNWGENSGNSKGGYNTNTLGGYIQNALAHCENPGVIYVGDLDPNSVTINHNHKPAVVNPQAPKPVHCDPLTQKKIIVDGKEMCEALPIAYQGCGHQVQQTTGCPTQQVDVVIPICGFVAGQGVTGQNCNK